MPETITGPTTDRPADTTEPQVLTSDDEAIEVARALVPRLADGAAKRDRERRLPHAQVRELSHSGLLGITVPRALGGADVRASTVAEVLRLLGTADLSLAQIPQPHFTFLNALRLRGSVEAQQRVFGDVLAGALVSNAQAERSGTTAHTYATRLEQEGSRYLINGVKYYATGSLFADWIAVVAPAETPDGPRPHTAYVRANAPGVRVEDDWNGMGQRTTASGTVHLADVAVDRTFVLSQYRIFEGPTTYGAFAQLLHAAIDTGVARGALSQAAEFVRAKSRPWSESGVGTAAEDPLLIQRFGELEVDVRSAEALLATAAARVDAANAVLDATVPRDSGQAAADVTAEASVAVAAAKVVAGRTAVAVSSALFEVAGTRATAEGENLHRLWRDARTHTVHDPVRWKVQRIGDHCLNRRRPPRHGQL
ncbi:SfnB family sulfur acquisition oxidoreductase [Nocardiopsis gilva YIM 90087]|uniref:Dibenzothiophene monooxygenase n=1 Tax=Nocardiopsis gilva YIM 90087 TaxID=1235441 RepID=A0A223SBJ5_9ACTN|nr:SfnB family sulfur acquisition oxidoreductase [Nocardiopsis gilva]ASU85389.1 SfnB family sulfur acquisition oxidoreductase [Nocardiopsis gilva YIM 90087]